MSDENTGRAVAALWLVGFAALFIYSLGHSKGKRSERERLTFASHRCICDHYCNECGGRKPENPLYGKSEVP